VNVIRLDDSNVDAASHVLARAFQDDPLQSYVFPDPAERAALSPAHFAPLIRYGLLAGEVWTTPDPVRAAAVWWPPAHTEMNEDALERAGFNRLPDTIGAAAFRRFMGVLDYMEPFHRRDMPRPHWYAMVIGVDPLVKGQGIGGRLLAEVLGRADTDGAPCYLETCQPSNVPFYQKSGFEVLVEGTEPMSGLRYWTFKREPLSSAEAGL
jgi:GNAT superfamily N-acetyltransferase